MVSTHKANKNAHPGNAVLAYTQTRRSKKQIEEDNAMARKAAHASKAQAAVEYHAVIQRMAELEDEMALAEKVTQTHAEWPDLQVRSGPPRPPQVKECAAGASCSQEPLQVEGENDDSVSEEGDPKGDPESEAEAANPSIHSGDDEDGPDPEAGSAPRDKGNEDARSIQDQDSDQSGEPEEKRVVPARRTESKKRQ
jgi:hypothetical protein